MHLNSKLLFEQFGKKYFLNGLRVLEIGPSGSPTMYQKIIDNPTLKWHTIDFENSEYIGEAKSSLTYVLQNPYKFPVESDSYDIVISGQVIEHVGKIWEWTNEIKRVLKNGGLMITINPVSWPYHEAPIDCWRIFPEGIKALASENNLSVIECFCDSLEINEIQKLDAKSVFIPGQSYRHAYENRKVRVLALWNKFIRIIPVFKNYLQIPFEVSYDTFSVLKK